jgi:hypothetical protein
MKCLENYIGISTSCGDERSPVSGLYIDSYQGISMKSLAAIDSKYVNAKKMLQDKINLVGHILSARIGDIMATSMVNYAIDSVVSKSFCDKYITGESGNPGMKITKNQSKMAVLLLHIPLYLT